MISMPVLVTAYCLAGTTATGSRVRAGTVAVDPQLIPLHSRLRIPGYGSGRALDTGSAVIGHHIDVWMHSCVAAQRWGVHHTRIEVGRPGQAVRRTRPFTFPTVLLAEPVAPERTVAQVVQEVLSRPVQADSSPVLRRPCWYWCAWYWCRCLLHPLQPKLRCAR